MTKATMAAAAESIKAVLLSLDANRNEYVARTGADNWTIARQHAQILAQNIEISAVSFSAGSALRDRAMAENIRWILDREGPDAKMVVWAHNGHVEAEQQERNGSMGSHLRRMFGGDMVVFGFAFNQGGFQAVEMPFPSERGLRVFEVPPAPQDSLDGMLASAGLRVAALNLRAVPRDGPVGKWFSEPRATRSIGAGYGESFAVNFFTKQVTPEIYDALLFVETTTAARPLGKEDGPGSQQRLAAPSNTDFEKGEAGETPADWQVRPKLRRYDFQIATSGERPHDGTRCAMIRRLPGTHYGEVVGRLGQRLDAAGYRGKRIRLRAAARADVSGPGNLSALRLVISRKQDVPDGTIFDSGDKYPVTSSDWRVYEILADVPQDADTIVYGLDLVGDGTAWLDSVSVDLIEP
jgi:erythromycin esterase